MQKQFLTWGLALALLAAMAVSTGAEEWALKADIAESCSCNPTCPCLFGSPPTLDHCDFVGLVEISESHFGDVDLNGISFVYTGSFGKWVKYTAGEEATDEQVKAIGQLFEEAYGLGGMEILSSVKAPISVERTADNITFSVPGSTVEIEVLKGTNGEPIKIQNLPAEGLPFPRLNDHTQYKSVTLQHDSEDKEFSYSGTTGYTAKLDVKGGK